MTPTGRTSVVLFTRDLRVHEQPALAEAVRTSDVVVPLFVFDQEILRRQRTPNRLAFLLEALADLRVALRRRGGDLIVRRGDPVVETLRLVRAVDAQTVFVGSDASAYAQRREERLARERVDLRVVNTISVVAPGALVPAEHDHYRVFTPYWRRWQALAAGRPLPAPDLVRAPAGIEPGALPTLRALTPEAPSPELPTGGEREGRRRLEAWLAEGLPRYRDANVLAANATSRLSPYLHFGCVPPFEVAARAGKHQQGEEFLRQLCWRDFFLQLLAANPSMAREDLHPGRRTWRSDDEAFARWREGRTGYPIVDAAMRQLAREGWLPNRARLIVASFLTKTLGLDWRLGADVFSELLVDADLANNVGNWQWVAGTGTDTRPNRVLNPIAQATRFDPDGEYVRRYVSELADLEGPDVHEPWKAPLARVAPDYPPRVVDHVAAHRRRLDAVGA
jgi:deoxyribodipyrimidine photo-lyase